MVGVQINELLRINGVGIGHRGAPAFQRVLGQQHLLALIVDGALGESVPVHKAQRQYSSAMTNLNTLSPHALALAVAQGHPLGMGIGHLGLSYRLNCAVRGFHLMMKATSRPSALAPWSMANVRFAESKPAAARKSKGLPRPEAPQDWQQHQYAHPLPTIGSAWLPAAVPARCCIWSRWPSLRYPGAGPTPDRTWVPRYATQGQKPSTPAWCGPRALWPCNFCPWQRYPSSTACTQRTARQSPQAYRPPSSPAPLHRRGQRSQTRRKNACPCAGVGGRRGHSGQAQGSGEECVFALALDGIKIILANAQQAKVVLQDVAVGHPRAHRKGGINQAAEVDALQILANQCQTVLVAQVAGQFFENEICNVCLHLRGE